MTESNDYSEAIALARRLVERAAHPKRGTIAVSRDLADVFMARDVAGTESSSPEPEAAASTPRTTATATVTPSIDLSAVDTLDDLRRMVAECRQCGLCETRTQTVFSDGSATAQLVFVGEAPGADEDRQGVPFVGRAGQLLTDIIVKGMKMRREDVYICNVLKCRPPNNRDPLPSEKEQCGPYLARQLELLKPKVICALGKQAANTLLRTEETLGRLRGKWHRYQGIPVRVTYHPAYLLRTPADKKLAWDDVQHVMRALRGEEDPGADGASSDASGASLFPE